MSGLGYMN